jgi:hypothetical protein
MNKTMVSGVLFVLICILASTWSVGGMNTEQNKDPTTAITEHTYCFSAPTVHEYETFSTLAIPETNAYITEPGNPMLPYYTETIELPFTTKIKQISCTIAGVETIPLNQKICPAQQPQPYDAESQINQPQINTVIYENNALYPSMWFSYRTGGGLNKADQRVTFLTINIYPLRYIPTDDYIEYSDTITLNIGYEKPEHPTATPDEYDLLIISYTPFAPLLQPLVDHKEGHNIKTKLVTLEDITDESYFPVEGRDIQEQIKYFIKNAIESWGIIYVMLVGNYNKLPIRYTHLETDTGGFYEELEYISDLYYADIYDGEGNFSSWDSDGDAIYGEWPYPEDHAIEDIRDLYPDVYVGRLACMWRYEVKAVVNKIITYEETTYDTQWFNRILCCGGDTFDKDLEEGTDYNEGEEANAQAITYMDGFSAVTLWASLHNLTTATITDEITQGTGFLYMVGHGNPRNWATHNNGDYQNWTEGLYNKDILTLKNTDKYPILMVGGCHNSQFDVTPLTLLHNFTRAWIWSTWVPECWSWVFIKNPRGGAIASLGSSGYGGVNIGDYNENGIPDCVEGADGWFETQFFRLYNEEHIDMLGATYAHTVSDYVANFPVFTNRYDCKIVETHIFMGDPSLKIGGYPPI